MVVVDFTSVVTPGAQALVTAILSDSWAHARSALAGRWARRTPANAASPGSEAVEDAGRELESARSVALALAGDGDAADRSARMELFLAGYLLGRLTARPDLAEAVAELPVLLGSSSSLATTSPGDAAPVHNVVTGTVRGNVVQARDIHGGVRFG